MLSYHTMPLFSLQTNRPFQWSIIFSGVRTGVSTEVVKIYVWAKISPEYKDTYQTEILIEKLTTISVSRERREKLCQVKL